MTKNFLDRVKDPEILKWFLDNWGKERFNTIVQAYVDQGWKFDQTSGLLRKETEDPRIKDIIFPRPQNYHRLPVDAQVRTKDGEGWLLVDEGNILREYGLIEGTHLRVNAGTNHALAPKPGRVLETRLVFDDVFGKAQEICETPFYQFGPWQEYFRNK
jgi:hypothetical protein